MWMSLVLEAELDLARLRVFEQAFKTLDDFRASSFG